MQDVAKCVPDCRPPTGFQNACPRCGQPYYDFEADEAEGVGDE